LKISYVENWIENGKGGYTNEKINKYYIKPYDIDLNNNKPLEIIFFNIYYFSSVANYLK